MMKLKAAIFDLDGTLLDSMGVWSQIDVEFLGKRGLTVPEDYLEAIAPLGFEEAARYTIRRFDFPEQPEELVCEWYKMAETAYASTIALKPHAAEYLQYLHSAGVKIAAATSSDPQLFERALEHNKIRHYFSHIVTVREVNRGKGFPDIYLLAAKKLGERPQDCVVYEDILQGVAGALAGNFRVVAMADESSAKDREQIQKLADVYIEDYIELMAERK